MVWRYALQKYRTVASNTLYPAQYPNVFVGTFAGKIKNYVSLGQSCRIPGMLEFRILERYDIGRQFYKYEEMFCKSVRTVCYGSITKIVWKFLDFKKPGFLQGRRSADLPVLFPGIVGTGGAGAALVYRPEVRLELGLLQVQFSRGVKHKGRPEPTSNGGLSIP